MLDSDQLETKFMLALNLTSTCISSYLDGLNSKHSHISTNELKELSDKAKIILIQLKFLKNELILSNNAIVYLEQCINILEIFSKQVNTFLNLELNKGNLRK